MSNTIFLKGVKNELWLKCHAAIRQDEGKPIDVNFRVKFRKPSMREVKDMQQNFQEAIVSFDVDTMIDLLSDYILDWDMPGNDGNTVEFREENLELALDDIDYFNAICNGFADLISGRDSQRLGNSKTSAGRGPRRH